MSVAVELLEQLPGARPHNLKSLRGEPFTGVSTDSRTIRSGELFVALRGDKFDGHNFMKEAFDHGAAAAIVDVRWLELNQVAFGPCALVGVSDTCKALGELARAHRRNFDIPVIGVAGSNGKTTTKELIASVLSAGVVAAVPGGQDKRPAPGTGATTTRILKTEGTLNNHIGVPLTVLRLEPQHKAAVVELGTNHLGEVASLCEIAEPTHGLITNIGREHLEFFGTLDNVARAEGELFDWLAQSGGTAFVNADEPRIVALAERLKKRWRYGFAAADADVRGIDHGLAADGTGKLGVHCAAEGAKFETRVGLVGRHHVHNALAAAAVGLHFAIEPAQIQAALASAKAAKHRMNVFQVRGITILDDTYNANPDSMLAALHTLAALPCKGRRIAALGNMGELGGQSEALHQEIGRAVRSLKVDALFTVGELGRIIHEAAALGAGAHCGSREELAKLLKATVQPGDVVLLKASRSVGLDGVVEGLR